MREVRQCYVCDNLLTVMFPGYIRALKEDILDTAVSWDTLPAQDRGHVWDGMADPVEEADQTEMKSLGSFEVKGRLDAEGVARMKMVSNEMASWGISLMPGDSDSDPMLSISLANKKDKGGREVDTSMVLMDTGDTGHSSPNLELSEVCLKTADVLEKVRAARLKTEEAMEKVLVAQACQRDQLDRLNAVIAGDRISSAAGVRSSTPLVSGGQMKCVRHDSTICGCWELLQAGVRPTTYFEVEVPTPGISPITSPADKDGSKLNGAREDEELTEKQTLRNDEDNGAGGGQDRSLLLWRSTNLKNILFAGPDWSGSPAG